MYVCRNGKIGIVKSLAFCGLGRVTHSCVLTAIAYVNGEGKGRIWVYGHINGITQLDNWTDSTFYTRLCARYKLLYCIVLYCKRLCDDPAGL